MVECVDALTHPSVVPLLCSIACLMSDNCDPYSAIGFSDLCKLVTTLIGDWPGELKHIPAVFLQPLYWKYGTGEHHSETRAILSYVVLRSYAAAKMQLIICSLVTYGCSEWVVGQNVTS